MATSIADIFQIFAGDGPPVPELAKAIKEKTDTVYRWHRRGRIPETAWKAVIKAASKRGTRLTADQILRANTPAGRRGKSKKTDETASV